METSTASMSPRAAIAAVVLAVVALAVLLLAATQQAAAGPSTIGPSMSVAAGPPAQECCGRGYP